MIIIEDRYERRDTGFTDRNGTKIYEYDILKNPLMLDKWKVEYIDDEFYACLMPNSGLIWHGDNAKYRVNNFDGGLQK